MEYIGTKFNRLTIIKDVGRKHRKVMVECLCECGNKTIVMLTVVKNGYTKSCGCLHKESSARNVRDHGRRGSEKRHGYSDKPEYHVWRTMKARCNNPKRKSYINYGGRGITVCERWLLFDNFIADMGPRPTDKHSLDRINNNGNYTTENCRWATMREQSNNKRSNKLLTYEGVTMTETQWCRKLDLKARNAISQRLEAGWTKEKAFTVDKVSDIRERILKSHKFKKPQ